MKKVLIVFGTRPEAIKMAPIILELKKCNDFKTIVCITAQHRRMLDQVLHLFDIRPDLDLDLMTNNQTLAQITSRVVLGLDEVIKKEKPDLILVQGDTTTVMGTALSAFYNGILIGHVEAGLRSGNIFSPFPEELNRRIATLTGNFHFAPTETAVKALTLEGIPKNNIFLTGNTVIDALLIILNRPVPLEAKKILKSTKINMADVKILLVTAHRRENFGIKMTHICKSLLTLVERNADIVVVFPVHPNPNVKEPVIKILGNQPQIILTQPLEYDVLAHTMKKSYLVLTDSGGIQEEAPSLGKPVLVMRSETERPEGILAGTAKLVGVNEEKIIFEVEKLLNDQAEYQKMSHAINPYGEGQAARRILNIIKEKIINSSL